MLPLNCFNVVVQFEFKFFEFEFKLNLFEGFCKRKEKENRKPLPSAQPAAQPVYFLFLFLSTGPTGYCGPEPWPSRALAVLHTLSRRRWHAGPACHPPPRARAGLGMNLSPDRARRRLAPSHLIHRIAIQRSITDLTKSIPVSPAPFAKVSLSFHKINPQSISVQK